MWALCCLSNFLIYGLVYLTVGSGPSITTNNTEILITAIGEDGGLPSLTCHTDLIACCRSVADNNGMGSLGQWTFPDGSVILLNGASATAGQQFYINRNGLRQIIGLNRRAANNPVTPTGSYCCTVPTTGGEMTLCANLGESIIAVFYVYVFMKPYNSPSSVVIIYPLLQLHLLQSHVLIISRPSLMEAYPMLVDPLTTDQWVLQLFKPALVTTLWLECQWGLVGVIESGVGHLQCVRVRNGWMCNSVCVECVPVPIVTCSALISLTNGDITPDSRSVGTVATYTCDTGYTLSGDTTRTCGSAGVWSGSAPTCQGKEYKLVCWQLTDCAVSTATCPDLTVPANGVIIYSSSTSPHPQGTIATQSCLNGYVPSTTSTATRVCGADRLWSGSDLTCQCKLVQWTLTELQSPTPIVPPVYVSMGTTNYVAMNSQVAIETIRDTTETALTCRTDSTICCTGQDNPNNANGLGDWLFPNRTVVTRNPDITDSDTDLLYSIGDTGALRLHRRGSVLGPTGSYCCVIPDNTGVNMTFCVQLREWSVFWSCYCIVPCFSDWSHHCLSFHYK